MNYTRKLQHFAAYLIPLLMHTHAAKNIEGPLTLTWGNWITMLGFLILIKPIRESSTFFMLQFNSLDRPEDRPNTLSWSGHTHARTAKRGRCTGVSRTSR